MLKFSNNDINEFILLLRKGAYPYECIGDWKNISEKYCLKRRTL